jgi:hypothetical protein
MPDRFVATLERLSLSTAIHQPQNTHKYGLCGIIFCANLPHRPKSHASDPKSVQFFFGGGTKVWASTKVPCPIHFTAFRRKDAKWVGNHEFKFSLKELKANS